MTVFAPPTWWRGLGGLTRSGSPVEGLSWALYDFANTIFSFAIVSFAMGPWAVRFLGEAQGTFLFTLAASASVALNAAVSPVLGAMSDRTGGRKRYLLVFTVLCIVPTVLIGFVDIGLGLLLFALANFAYQAALIYYDALLPDVSLPRTRGRLSGIGVALGYLGAISAGLLYRLTLEEGRTTPASFVVVGSLFAVFALPIFLLVRERLLVWGQRFRVTDAIRSWSQLRTTVEHARQRPGLLRFIVARFLYSDPINTAIVVMSVFAINAAGFSEAEALNVLLGLIVVAIIASFFWGIVADRIGPKRTLLLVLGSWMVGLLILGLVLAEIPFLIAGAILGSGLGGAAVTDRLLLLRLVRADEVGEMFGLYGLVGKLSAIVGPLLYGAIILVLQPRLGTFAYQVAVLSLLVLMVIGFVVLLGVPQPDAEDEPQAADLLSQGAVG